METSSKLQSASKNNSPQNLNPTHVSKKEMVKLVLKLLLVVGIFWLMFRNGLVTAESFHKIFASPLVLVACLALMFLNLIFSTYRWQLLLHCHRADLTFKETLRYTVIGQFFNIALPGAVSGDVVKAVYVSSKFKEKRAAILGSILFDRILGVSALIMVAAISTVVSQWVNWGGELPNALTFSVYALAACIFLFFSYLFISHRADPVLKIFKKLTQMSEKLGSLERIYVGMVHYRHHFKEVSRSIALSLIIHLFVVSIAFLLANTLSTNPLPFVGLSVIVPIGMLATAVPVLPAGVGTGHAAFYGLFHFVGSTQGAEVFSWIVFLQIIFGLVGGIVYLRTRLD